MNRAQQSWKQFKQSIYGDEPLHKVQDRECSLAFYAGMLAAVMEVSKISETAVDLNAGAVEMELYHMEISSALLKMNVTT